jgi:hypothetical protein
MLVSTTTSSAAVALNLTIPNTYSRASPGFSCLPERFASEEYRGSNQVGYTALPWDLCDVGRREVWMWNILGVETGIGDVYWMYAPNRRPQSQAWPITSNSATNPLRLPAVIHNACEERDTEACI